VDAITQKLGRQQIVLLDQQANFFGLESAGVWQTRGNGCLALTREVVLFRQWVPERELSIPRASIIKTEAVRSHLGKTQFTSLLKIRFLNERGEEDSAAWRVGDLPPWLADLSKSTR
jgi:hypothetical protein